MECISYATSVNESFFFAVRLAPLVGVKGLALAYLALTGWGNRLGIDSS